MKRYLEETLQNMVNILANSKEYKGRNDRDRELCLLDSIQTVENRLKAMKEEIEQTKGTYEF